MMNRMIQAGQVMLLVLMISSPGRAGDIKELSIPDVIAISLEHNLKLKIERIVPKVSEQSVMAAESVFDPSVSVGSTVSERRSHGGEVDFESSQRKLEARADKRLAYGTVLSLSLSAADNEDKTAASGSNSGNNALTVLSVVQPLLKGRGFEVNRRDITLAQYDYQRAKLDFRQALINTVVETQKRYWALYSAAENLSVHEKSLQLAKKFLAEMQERVIIGSAAALDTLQAEAEAAWREESVIVAENLMLNYQDSLLNFIYGGFIKQGTIKTIQTPRFEMVETDEEALLLSALTMRTDYLKAKLNLESNKTNVAYLNNRKHPQLNLTGSIGYNLGHSDNSLSAAYQDYYTGSIGLSLEFPWGMRRDKANYHAARLSLEQSNISLKEIESQLRLEIRSALRNLKSSNQRYQAATIAESLAEQKLEAERVKYENGLSTGYNVLQYQRDLTDAGVRRVEALIACQTAIIDLNRTVGVTLEKNNIQLQDLSY